MLGTVNVSMNAMHVPLASVGLLACKGYSTSDCHVQKALLQEL